MKPNGLTSPPELHLVNVLVENSRAEGGLVSLHEYKGIQCHPLATNLALGRVRQLLAYPNAEAEVLWDADSADSPVNSMLYLILGEHSVTAVLDDPNVGEMPAILEGIKTMMEMEILNTDVL